MKIINKLSTMILILVQMILMTSNKSWAETNQLGQKTATLCVACHGEKGISQNDLWPNLVSQKKEYLVKQLTAFQTGERKDPMMSPLVQNLSKDEIQAVALYFSTLTSN